MMFEAKNSTFFMQNSDPDSAKHTGRQIFFFQTGFEVAYLHKKVEFLASNIIICGQLGMAVQLRF